MWKIPVPFNCHRIQCNKRHINSQHNPKLSVHFYTSVDEFINFRFSKMSQQLTAMFGWLWTSTVLNIIVYKQHCIYWKHALWRYNFIPTFMEAWCQVKIPEGNSPNILVGCGSNLETCSLFQTKTIPYFRAGRKIGTPFFTRKPLKAIPFGVAQTYLYST